MCFTDGPAENCVAGEVFPNLQSKQGITGFQAIYEEPARPWKWVGQRFNFMHPVNVFKIETTDQGMLFIRY